MTTNENIPAEMTRSRFRSTWPLLLVAALFVVGAFSTWYFTWFGRELSDQDIATYLVDEQHPRKVQHALSEIQQRMEKNDPSVKQWYPQLIKLADSRETELRLTLAWMMGSDTKSPEFLLALQKLLRDPEPIVRRNAALALIRFGDASGRSELRSVFDPYVVKATTTGTMSSSLRSGATVSRGALLARIQNGTTETEIRSPLPGRVENLVAQTGARVNIGDTLLMLSSDEGSIWESLRGLALIGQQDELDAITRYVQKTPTMSERTKEQASVTLKAIHERLNAQ